MITREFTTLQSLEVFSRVFSLKGAIIVGAGLGEGPWIDLLKQHNSNVLLIEAQDDRFKQLEKTFADFDGWQVQQHVISAKQEESTFYIVTNSAESSLFSQEESSELWPHIKLKHQYTCQTATLDEISQTINFTVNWLVVDCLPTLPLLHGAENLLSHVDIVVVRMIVDEQLCRGAHASLQVIEEFMQKHNFLQISLEQELHPALAHGVYVRDYAELYQHEAELVTKHEIKSKDLRCKLEEVKGKSEKQQKQIEDLQINNDALNKNLVKCRIKLEKFTDERNERIKEQKQTIQELRKIGEDQHKQINELQVKLAQLTKERDELSIESAEIRQNIQELSRERDSLHTQIQKCGEESKDSEDNSANPYEHNRSMTRELNASLRDFAHKNLNMKGIKPSYIDYLATKAIQIEKSCVGRLATTVQDVVARQLTVECVQRKEVCIIEIGALYGVSLAILYNHMVTRAEEVKIICLDPFDGYYGQSTDVLLNSPVNESSFVRNMQISNVSENHYQIIKHYSTSLDAIEIAQTNTINCMVIDGDHSYEGVKFDFENYFPMLETGGYVIFDDYNAKEWPGVQKFVDEDLIKYSDFQFIGAISRTAVGRKKINTDS